MAFIELEKGDLFQDSIHILGYKEGGLGRVYFGYCKHRQMKVVIKTLRREIWERYELAEKWPSLRDGLIEGTLPFHPIDVGEYIYYIFFREARLICQSQNHPNVVKGMRLWWTEAGQPFFECEFVSDSEDLAALHKRIKEQSGVEHLSWLEVAHVAVSFCNGMIYISDEMLRAYNQTHPEDPALGFVHRDIKPENILITNRNQIKIIDLGLAKFILLKSPTMLSASPMAPGTPLYRSPEQQISYDAVMPSSDIYSLGVTLYELLGGSFPILSERAIALPEDVPSPFQAIIKKCLKQDMRERYQSFRELKGALIELIKAVKRGEISLNQSLRCESCGYISNQEGSYAEGRETPEVIVYRDHELVRVPAGSFYKGCSDENRREVLKKHNRSDIKRILDEEEYRKVYVDAYEIDVYPVTNEQYYRFVEETGYQPVPAHWKNWGRSDPPYPVEQANYPVVNVSYQDATAYCEWAGLRLPTGDEWEKAARGTDGRLYPWGNQYNPNLCNSAESGHQGPVAVDRYPEGKSPYGCYQMMGNVFEWVDESHPQSEQYKYLRGGSWAVSCGVLGIPFLHYIAARRDAVNAGGQRHILGFRCARDVEDMDTAKTRGPEDAEEVERCPLCGGDFTEFDVKEIKAPEKGIYTWNGFFDIE